MKRLMESVNTVLFECWDPIGISQDPSWPHDEYVDYVGGILGLVQRGASDNAIAEHLGALETGPIGIDRTSLEHRLNVVRRIRDTIQALRKLDETDGNHSH